LNGNVEGLYIHLPRVPRRLSTRPNWRPQLPQARINAPRPEPKGGKTRLRVRGWADPIRMTGEKTWHSVHSVHGILETTSLLLPMWCQTLCGVKHLPPSTFTGKFFGEADIYGLVSY
jgi:hypothetical protein